MENELMENFDNLFIRKEPERYIYFLYNNPAWKAKKLGHPLPWLEI
jgi:hypothetical protein